MTKEDEILSIVKDLSQKVDILSQILNRHTLILNEHTQKLLEHDQKFERIQEQLILIKEQLLEHDQRFERIQEQLILIQEDIRTKIPALFDAHGFHQDHLERNDESIEELQARVENHSIRIITLEHESKEQFKQLKQLSSTN